MALSQLEELVGFLGHEAAHVRLVALEHLLPYSQTHPAVFRADALRPVRQLQAMALPARPADADAAVRQLELPALTLLVNLSADAAVAHALAADTAAVDGLVGAIVQPADAHADLRAMLLANMAKADALRTTLGSDDRALNQLVDLFVRGHDRAYNPAASFDHLAYLFADLARHREMRAYLLQPQPYDGYLPLAKLQVFTAHASAVRRRGVAATLKNAAFTVDAHPALLRPGPADLLPYLLLPLAGPEDLDFGPDADLDGPDGVLPDLQLLPLDKAREPDLAVLRTHLDTLLLLTTTRPGRRRLRAAGTYPVIREVHLRVNDEAVREACDRLVQVLMRDDQVEDEDDKEEEPLVQV